MNKRRFLTKNQFKSTLVIITTYLEHKKRYSIFRLVFLFIFILMVFLSCNLYENEQIDISVLQGSWKWEKSIGGWGFEEIADTADYSYSLKVSELKATLLYDEEIRFEYIIQSTENTRLGLIFHSKTKINGHNVPSKYVITLEESLLVLSDNCFDCNTYYFKKSN